MKKQPAGVIDYEALAIAFRYEIRRFLNFSSTACTVRRHRAPAASSAAGDQGPPPRDRDYGWSLAHRRLQILHHSAVELIDRLEANGLIRRERSPRDGREVILLLTSKGERLLERLSVSHRNELRVQPAQSWSKLCNRLWPSGNNLGPHAHEAAPRQSIGCFRSGAHNSRRNLRGIISSTCNYLELARSTPVPPAAYSGSTTRISLLAALTGILAGIIAFLLYDLIGLFTNLAYYHEWSFHFRSPEHTALGPWIIVTPVIGGLIIGFMAKYGSEKIQGHGIPEAMEAVLTSRSRIEAKVA